MTIRDVPAFVPICKTADVRSGEARQFRPAAGRWRGKPMAVWNDDGTFYATNFICPHMGGPISEGKLTDGVVECPWHGWTFHVDPGLPAGDDEGHGISAYEVKIEGDDVMIGGMLRPSGT